eukprot:scaffold36301_cov57-Phaeocystis_antarctica.AAC.3
MCPAKSRDLAPPEPAPSPCCPTYLGREGRVVVKCQTRNYESVKSSPPTGSLARLAGGRSMLHSGQPPPVYRAPPPNLAALPIANTRPQRSTLAATTAGPSRTPCMQRDARSLRRRGSA